MTNEEAILILTDAPIELHSSRYDVHQDFVTAKKMAISALEKQIPKKPKEARKCADLLLGACPSCGDYTNSEGDYCWKCGQRLDWSEDE